MLLALGSDTNPQSIQKFDQHLFKSLAILCEAVDKCVWSDKSIAAVAMLREPFRIVALNIRLVVDCGDGRSESSQHLLRTYTQLRCLLGESQQVPAVIFTVAVVVMSWYELS